MPELPEVETIRKQLTEQLIGQVIKAIEVREPKSYLGAPLIGTKIIGVERIGKYLYIVMDDKREWEIHLKMTGRLVWGRDEYDKMKHTRVVITLTSGKLYFWDTRKFGYIKVKDGSRVELGPEPWKISDAELMRKLQKTGRAIKNVILDQNVLAGVGNIYANDGLWLSGIDPRRKANSLERSEVKKLRASICTVMERGLSTGGASDNSYVDGLGQQGEYQNEFLVYRRTGEACLKCGSAIVRVVVGGRGSWVCERCQK